MNSSSASSEIKRKKYMKAGKLYFLLLIILSLNLNNIFSQPVWVPGTPSVPSTGPLTITTNTGIDRAGTIYIVIFKTKEYANYTPYQIKTLAIGGPGMYSYVQASAVINVSGTDIGKVLQRVFDVPTANKTYSCDFVAESGGVLQSTVVRIDATTLPCPSIYVGTAFNNADRCVNGDGANKSYDLTTYSGFGGNYSNVLKGATWTISWGDGSPDYTYTSTYDNDGPGPVMAPGMEFLSVTHTYTVHDSCYRKAVLTIKNPAGCAAVGAQTEQKDVLLAGRDWDADGNGSQLLVNAADGSPDTIKVCAGTATAITLRDDGVWDCDQTFKTYPPGEINSGDRNVQFVYGMHPVTRVVENTITGDVVISGTYPGTANTTAGHSSGIINIPTSGMNPITNPHTLSDVITIPSTAAAKQKMHVYFKNWNKCNPYSGNPWDGTAVWDSIVIYVVPSPPAPTVLDKTICYGGDRTLSVTSTPVGTIRWYADAGLTNLLGTGISYVPVQTAAGVYNFWVNDQSVSGLQCIGPATMVTLTIREELSRPGPISGPAALCINATGQIFSVSADPPVMPIGGATEYFWTVPGDWTITAGQGTKQITCNVGSTTGGQTVSVISRYITTPVCNSTSQTYSVSVNPQPVGPTLASKTPNLAAVCAGQNVSATFNSGTGGVGCSDAFQYRYDGTGGWT
ncbi:MAG: hypothetical protein KBG40_04320, partial [Bacteroidales bacterium]|nr:hypothetical protein [Bacteroidales bacterium]